MPKGGHVRLTGEECDEKDRILAGRSFHVRYLGSNDILYEKGKGCTDRAVREVYSRYGAKSSVKSLAKRELFVSANCVSLYASNEHAVIFKFQTVNITFCNTSEENHSAFAFVVKYSQSGALRAHVVNCESPSQANDICLAMHEAFKVRSDLFQAKRVDRAGWGNGLLSSPLKGANNANRREGRDTELDGNENYKSIDAPDGIDSNNNGFGEFACGFVLPCKGDICIESENNNNVNNANLTRYPERLATGDNESTKLFAQNGTNFTLPLAKVLLQKEINRSRSQSLPKIQMPWTKANGAEWGCFQGSTLDEDDIDDFSLLARERSSSLKLLTAE